MSSELFYPKVFCGLVWGSATDFREFLSDEDLDHF